ncbi:MAG: formylglycine-generating enzyme family protein [Candidatus Poribacteria bacterium]|nr:formylglycine-generating enzyme family protein [Candidatus Poribacteria bacterium]
MKFKEVKIPFVLLMFMLLTFACRERASAPLVGTLPIQTITTPKDEAVMVYVPAGEFLMGTSDADIEYYKQIFPLRRIARFDNERPQRTVFVDAFYIDKYEVTNKQYKQFLTETGYKPKHYLDRLPYNAPNLPAVVLEWEDAVAYTVWAGKRLPTEAEWEKAARGTDGRIWPWGNEWDGTKLSGNDGTGLKDGYKETAPVGQFPQGASPYGAHDMAGNLWEWVSDWYDPDYYRTSPPNINPKGPETGDGHVLKGGGWAENLDFTRCANRLGGEPGSLLRGFRCVIDAPPGE